MASLKTEVAIAHACNEAINKFASDRLKAAHMRLIAAVIENQTPAFQLFTPAGTYEYTAEHVRRINRAWLDYVEALADEAADHSNHVTAIRHGSDDVDEFIAELEYASYAQREDEMEEAS